MGVNDIFVEGAYIDEKYGELVLPSGARLGHRSMHKYYKQRLRSQNDAQMVLRKDNLKALEAKIARRHGWKIENSISGAKPKSNGASRAISNMKVEAKNMKMWHNLHMWGAGGRGS